MCRSRSKMFKPKANYLKLRTNLRLVINRLKLLEKKKSEMALKARKDIADYITQGKDDRARIRVEHIVREDYLVEAMEILELFCDLLLARFGLIEKMKEMEPSLEEAIASIIWATPRLSSDIPEFNVLTQQFTGKYGKEYVEYCRSNQGNLVNEKLEKKLSIYAPPKMLIENYMVEIACAYNVPFVPDPMALDDGCGVETGDLLNFGDDFNKGPHNFGGGGPNNFGGGGGPNNFGGGGGGGGGGMVTPAGSRGGGNGGPPIDITPPPAYSLLPQAQGQPGNQAPQDQRAPPPMSYPAPSTGYPPAGQNIPPYPTNQPPGQPPYPTNTVPPQGPAGFNDLPPPGGANYRPVPSPRGLSHTPPPGGATQPSAPPPSLPSVPFLPSPPTTVALGDISLNLPDVPSSIPPGGASGGDDIDFDDLTKRFEDLKKRK